MSKSEKSILHRTPFIYKQQAEATMTAATACRLFIEIENGRYPSIDDVLLIIWDTIPEDFVVTYAVLVYPTAITGVSLNGMFSREMQSILPS